MLKLTTDRHEASRGLSATAEFLVRCALNRQQPETTFNMHRETVGDNLPPIQSECKLMLSTQLN